MRSPGNTSHLLLTFQRASGILTWSKTALLFTLKRNRDRGLTYNLIRSWHFLFHTWFLPRSSEVQHYVTFPNVLQNLVLLCPWGAKGGSDTTSDSFVTSSAVTCSSQSSRGRGNDCLPFVLWFLLTVRASIFIWGLATLGTCMPTSRLQRSFQKVLHQNVSPQGLLHQHTGHPVAGTLSIPPSPSRCGPRVTPPLASPLWVVCFDSLPVPETSLP